jgi:stearoyl-CoA desaturase (delta-9 desaturase)
MSSVYPRKAKVVDPDAAPIDSNIPDNYVDHTLKTQKPLPPITWSNWWKELNWLSFAILTLTPTLGIIGAMFTKLRWETLLFSIFYYYVTGLG